MPSFGTHNAYRQEVLLFIKTSNNYTQIWINYQIPPMDDLLSYKGMPQNYLQKKTLFFGNHEEYVSCLTDECLK